MGGRTPEDDMEDKKAARKYERTFRLTSNQRPREDFESAQMKERDALNNAFKAWIERFWPKDSKTFQDVERPPKMPNPLGYFTPIPGGHHLSPREPTLPCPFFEAANVAFYSLFPPENKNILLKIALLFAAHEQKNPAAAAAASVADSVHQYSIYYRAWALMMEATSAKVEPTRSLYETEASTKPNVEKQVFFYSAIADLIENYGQNFSDYEFLRIFDDILKIKRNVKDPEIQVCLQQAFINLCGHISKDRVQRFNPIVFFEAITNLDKIIAGNTRLRRYSEKKPLSVEAQTIKERLIVEAFAPPFEDTEKWIDPKKIEPLIYMARMLARKMVARTAYPAAAAAAAAADATPDPNTGGGGGKKAPAENDSDKALLSICKLILENRIRSVFANSQEFAKFKKQQDSFFSQVKEANSLTAFQSIVAKFCLENGVLDKPPVAAWTLKVFTPPIKQLALFFAEDFAYILPRNFIGIEKQAAEAGTKPLFEDDEYVFPDQEKEEEGAAAASAPLADADVAHAALLVDARTAPPRYEDAASAPPGYEDAASAPLANAAVAGAAPLVDARTEPAATADAAVAGTAPPANVSTAPANAATVSGAGLFKRQSASAGAAAATAAPAKAVTADDIPPAPTTPLPVNAQEKAQTRKLDISTTK